MRIYKITTRHSQLVDVSTPHLPADLSGVGGGHITILPSTYSNVIQGSWDLYIDSADYTCANFSNYNEENGANGDGVEYKAYMGKGTYTLYLIARKDSVCPILKVYIDNSLVATFDMYNDTRIYAYVFKQENITISEDGLKTIKLLIDGKNASSTNYFVYINTIQFTRTA